MYLSDVMGIFKLVDVGLVASEDGRPTMHQFSWELVN